MTMIVFIAPLLLAFVAGVLAGMGLGAWIHRHGREQAYAQGIADAGRLGFRGLEER